MDAPFTVKPLGLLARTADYAMYPVMRFLMEINGTPSESPQRTHRWNRHSIDPELVRSYTNQLAWPRSDDSAWPLVSFLIHLPWIGWQRYVVLEPVDLPPNASWHIGWVWDSGATVSRITLRHGVRMLRGPGRVGFFGVGAEGSFVRLRIVGYGKLGMNVPYRRRWIL